MILTVKWHRDVPSQRGMINENWGFQGLCYCQGILAVKPVDCNTMAELLLLIVYKLSYTDAV